MMLTSLCCHFTQKSSFQCRLPDDAQNHQADVRTALRTMVVHGLDTRGITVTSISPSLKNLTGSSITWRRRVG
ncbi:hypothetical protein DFH29DRAFT_1081295, partial [Suillus ampliporus]